MSRTYKTRPDWVKRNDPKSLTTQHHQHIVVHREPTGNMIKKTRSKWVYPEGWAKMIDEEYEVPEYRMWSEVVECDMDKSEVPWLNKDPEKDKRCYKSMAYSHGCICCSRWYAKRLSAKSQRASINQQLHNAVRDRGWTTDPDEWYDVDITTAGVAEDWKFWD